MQHLFLSMATATLLLLAGCETTPAAGEAATAQVIAVPLSRADLRGYHGSLHAAVRAGVTSEDATRGRLVRGECAERDAGARDGIRFREATTILPEGTPTARGILVDIAKLSPAAEGLMRQHGDFVALAPTLQAAEAIPSPVGSRLHTPCHPKDLPKGQLRVQLLGAVAAWQLDFARSELARHDQFSDTELAAGRAVMLACQLKVADGGDWYRPVWLARTPEDLSLRLGDVVQLRTGALADSKDVEPMPQVMALERGRPAPGGNAVVRCR
jgi:hypothetical protein